MKLAWFRSGVGLLRWSAAILLVGGLILGLLFGSLALAALAFGFGAALLGLGQLWEAQDRGGRLIGFVLLAGGAFTMVDAAIWSLSGLGA